MLPHVTAIRYVTPLREGGSLPGLMEADDLGTYVVKFHGAGQGRKALVAEVIVGELARTLGLPVPALVTAEVDPILAANEPDEEVQDLLRASPGRNLGLDFLPGALDLDAAAFDIDPHFAGRVLWFDALVGNVDRSWRNPNMLFWHGAPYLIDHGAALTFHHNWPAAANAAGRPYDAREHALLGCAPDLDAAAALAVDDAAVAAARGPRPRRMAGRRARLRAARGRPRGLRGLLRRPPGRAGRVAAGACAPPWPPGPRRGATRAATGRAGCDDRPRTSPVRVRGAARRAPRRARRVHQRRRPRPLPGARLPGRGGPPRSRPAAGPRPARRRRPRTGRSRLDRRDVHQRRRHPGRARGDRPPFPLAHRAAQHRGPGRPRAHRADRRPGGRDQRLLGVLVLALP